MLQQRCFLRGEAHGTGAATKFSENGRKQNQRLKRSLELLKSYIAAHGWKEVRSSTRANGFHLGHWITMRRSQYRRGELPDWLQQELEAIPGWTWTPREDELRRKLALFRRYFERHGWERLTEKTVVDGVNVGLWIRVKRRAYAAGKLPVWLREELETLPGWSSWATGVLSREEQVAIEALRRYVDERGWSTFDSATRFNEVRIGRYVTRWRTARRRGQLDPRLAEQLVAIPGWSWKSTYYREHHRRALSLLKVYVAEQGCDSIKRATRFRGFNLGFWCLGRRAAYRNKKLAEWLQRELEKIPGWSW